jgi:hypothetical protein
VPLGQQQQHHHHHQHQHQHQHQQHQQQQQHHHQLQQQQQHQQQHQQQQHQHQQRGNRESSFLYSDARARTACTQLLCRILLAAVFTSTRTIAALPPPMVACSMGRGCPARDSAVGVHCA